MLERVVWVSVGTTGPGEMLRRKGLLEENWDAGEGARGPANAVGASDMLERSLSILLL